MCVLFLVFFSTLSRSPLHLDAFNISPFECSDDALIHATIHQILDTVSVNNFWVIPQVARNELLRFKEADDNRRLLTLLIKRYV